MIETGNCCEIAGASLPRGAWSCWVLSRLKAFQKAFSVSAGGASKTDIDIRNCACVVKHASEWDAEELGEDSEPARSCAALQELQGDTLGTIATSIMLDSFGIEKSKTYPEVQIGPKVRSMGGNVRKGFWLTGSRGYLQCWFGFARVKIRSPLLITLIIFVISLLPASGSNIFRTPKVVPWR